MQQALLPGDCELQQLLHTFQLLGTPNEETCGHTLPPHSLLH